MKPSGCAAFEMFARAALLALLVCVAPAAWADEIGGTRTVGAETSAEDSRSRDPGGLRLFLESGFFAGTQEDVPELDQAGVTIHTEAGLEWEWPRRPERRLRGVHRLGVAGNITWPFGEGVGRSGLGVRYTHPLGAHTALQLFTGPCNSGDGPGWQARAGCIVNDVASVEVMWQRYRFARDVWSGYPDLRHERAVRDIDGLYGGVMLRGTAGGIGTALFYSAIVALIALTFDGRGLD